uniref:Uncharacterized protein n=1 Tax=Panagrolaimus superbus TaxID=310955 RepID=A0A914YFS0_9BILA
MAPNASDEFSSEAIRNARRQNVGGVATNSRVNAVYTIDAGARVQQPGNNTVYISQGQPVYIIPKAAVDEARAAASSRRNCILCIIITKLIVIAVVVIIIVSTN